MKKLRLLLAVLAVSFALPAAAQSFYIGGSLGRSHFKEACDGVADCDDRDTQFNLFAGWQFNRFLALEAGYRDFGHVKVDTSNGNLKANALELDAVGTLPLFRGFSLLGRVGVFHGNMKGSGAEENNNNVTFGAGVQYDFTPAFALRGEWQRYRHMGGGDFDDELDVDALSLAALFRF